MAERRPVAFCAICGVTLNARMSATKSAKGLVAATVDALRARRMTHDHRRRRPSRSTVPDTASGSRRRGVRVIARFSPWKSRSPLRPGDGGCPNLSFATKALHRRPRLNLRPVDREALVRQERARLLGQRFGEEFARDLSPEQPVAVCGFLLLNTMGTQARLSRARVVHVPRPPISVSSRLDRLTYPFRITLANRRPVVRCAARTSRITAILPAAQLAPKTCPAKAISLEALSVSL